MIEILGCIGIIVIVVIVLLAVYHIFGEDMSGERGFKSYDKEDWLIVAILLIACLVVIILSLNAIKPELFY
jgi:hypothetical protein